MLGLRGSWWQWEWQRLDYFSRRMYLESNTTCEVVLAHSKRDVELKPQVSATLSR
jgi:hypothetical protein